MDKLRVSRRHLVQGAAVTAALGTQLGSLSLPASAAAQDLPKVSWAAWVVGPVDKENDAQKEVASALGINVDELAFERSTWEDQINTRIAGGDIPDIIEHDSVQKVQTYVDQGILAEVPYDVIKEHAPTYFAAAKAFTPDCWLACEVGGKNYGLPWMEEDQVHPFTNGWRKDWLDKIGMTTPPATIDEYEQAFKLLVEQNPGGASGMYPLSCAGKGWGAMSFFVFFGAYGVFPTSWMDAGDGTVFYGGVSPQAKEALTRLNQWYQAGYIDPEYTTLDDSQWLERWSQGRVAYAEAATWYRLIPGGAYYDAVKQADPAADLVMVDAPKGPEGKFGYIGWGTVAGSFTFGSQVGEDQDKMVNALKLLEGTMTDIELGTKIRYGVEGTTWHRDPTTNEAVYLPPYDRVENRGPLGIEFFRPLVGTPELARSFKRSDIAELQAHSAAGNVTNYVPILGAAIDPEANKVRADIDPIQANAYIDFINGNRSLDEWDDFVSEWNESGGQQLVEAANEAFKDLDATRQRIAAAIG